MVDIEFALQVMLVGFSLVLFTLFLLYLIIILFGRLFAVKNSVFTDELSIVEKEPVLDNLTAQKMAIISAAIQAYLYEAPAGYIIKKIEPLHNSFTNNWATEGRKELLKMNQEIEKLRREKSGKKIF